ncbi:MAG: histidinol-phosphatase HisJ family protein [Verrucomicrobia bacterium]|nr:histidinol-phosphatase HisJ family protein [Verrucomicrobiota bacterium]
MRLPADYHLHTPLCRHATGTPAEYAARALALGLPEIGFADHSPMPRDDFDNWRMRADQLGEYVESVQRARRDHPRLAIRLALEVDYVPGQEAWIRDLAARHAWDYLIGSVHYVSDTWAIDDPGRLSEWHRRDPDEVWALYFDRLTRAAASGLFDIIGHADLPKKFGFRPRADCRPWFDRFLRAACATAVAVELNTAGLRKDCREIYPAPDLLQRMAQAQVPITFGSDAHAVAEVGANLAQAAQLARDCGYTHGCRFAGRQRRLEPL